MRHALAALLLAAAGCARPGPAEPLPAAPAPASVGTGATDARPVNVMDCFRGGVPRPGGTPAA